MNTQLLRVVVGVLANRDGRVLVNQRLPGTHMAGFWEFPGGKLDPGEAPRAGLDRELAEELGIKVLGAEPLMTLEHDYPNRRVQLSVWQVTGYAGEPESREGQPLRWVQPKELGALGLLPADEPIIAALVARSGPG